MQTAPGFSLTLVTTQTCVAYNRTTNELVCSAVTTDSAGGVTTQNSTSRYASVGDFVGDAPKVFLYATADTHPQSVVSSTSGTSSTNVSFTQSANVTYVYDSQRRLMRLDTQAVTNGTPSALTLAFSSWDSSGRPTAASDGTTTFTYAYDDNARTITVTSRNPSSTGTTVLTFDGSGNRTRATATAGASTTEATDVIQSTAEVCR